MRRQVVGRARAQADADLLELELEHARQDLPDVAQQLEHAAGGRRRCPSRAPPSSRRARSGRRRAGRGRRCGLRITRVDEAGARRVAQAQDLALDGADRHPCRVGEALDARATTRRPPSATCSASIRSPSASSTPVTRSPLGDDAGARARAGGPRRRRARPPRPARRRARRGSTEWSSGMSSARRTVGASAGSARRACEGRRRSTCRPRLVRSASRRSSAVGLVAVARHDERARAAQPRVAPRGLGDLGAERLVARGAAQPELQQRALAEVRLGDGREHAGRGAPRARLAGVEHGHAQPALARLATRRTARSHRRR